MNTINSLLEETAAERYHIISESAADAIVVMDEHSTILSANGAIENIFGYSPDELVGQSLTLIMPERLRGQHCAEVERWLATGEKRALWAGFEWTGLTRNAEEIPLEISFGHVIKDGHHFFTGIIRDISERKAAEATHAHLAAIVESSNDAIFTKNLSGIITSWNNAAVGLLGWKADEIIGKPASILIPPDYAEEEDVLLARLRMGKSRINHAESIRLHKNGKRIQVAVTTSVIKNPAGEIVGFSKIMRGIAKRKRLETDLTYSNARLNSIIASAMDAIVSIDSEHRIIVFNAAAEQMFGWRKNEIIGEPIDWLLPERFRDIHRQHIANFAKTGTTSRRMGALGRLVGLRANGEEFPVEAAISQVETVREENGKAGSEKTFTVILRDINQREKTENDLRAANEELRKRSKQLEDTVTELNIFTYSLSHDMRAPLRAMKAFSDILVEQALNKLNSEERDYLKRISNSAGRINELIQDVMIYKQVSDTPVLLEKVDLEKLIFDIIPEQPRLTVNAAGIKIEHPLLPVMAHEGLLVRCISNLLVNAVKFVTPDVKPKVKIWNELVDSHVRTWIEDNGIGIDPRFHEKIFGFFERLSASERYEGTGIGLALVRKGITRMGGKVGVESEAGKGSRFWFELPKG